MICGRIDGGVFTMIRRILALGGISIAITFAQSAEEGRGPASRARAGTAKERQLFAYDVTIDPNYKPPKTPWGEPDLQGIWPINHLIAVPLERPKQYGDRLYLTDEEFARAQASLEARNKRLSPEPIPTGRHPADGDAAIVPDRRSAGRPIPRTHRLREEASGGDEEQLPSRSDGLRQRRRFRGMGPLHHSWHAGFDGAAQLQQRHPHHAVARLRGDSA